MEELLTLHSFKGVSSVFCKKWRQGKVMRSHCLIFLSWWCYGHTGSWTSAFNLSKCLFWCTPRSLSSCVFGHWFVNVCIVNETKCLSSQILVCQYSNDVTAGLTSSMRDTVFITMIWIYQSFLTFPHSKSLVQRSWSEGMHSEYHYKNT